jgi:hypothetical protein
LACLPSSNNYNRPPTKKQATRSNNEKTSTYALFIGS